MNKVNTLRQLAQVGEVAVPGRALGQIGEIAAGIAPQGKSAIPSLTGTATRQFPDAINWVERTITEVKNVAGLSGRDAAQITYTVLYGQQEGLAPLLLTRHGANISPIQALVDNGWLNVANIPGINSSGVLNRSNSVSSGLGALSGTATNSYGAAGGFLLYPNKTNNNQSQSVYQK